jgi:hypothetical protein
MCNFNRLNETFFGPGDCWPEELDWLGFDVYGFDPAASFGRHIRLSSDRHFRKTATEYDRKPGSKRSSCTAS